MVVFRPQFESPVVSPKAPLSDAATEDLFVGFVDGNRHVYEQARDSCERRTPANPLSQWERLAVWLYATTRGFWYKRVNDPLRNGHSLSETAGCVAEHLAAGLQKLPTYKGRAYRGIRVTATEFASIAGEYPVGGLVNWAAFSSASAVPEYATTGNVLFTITSHTGRVLGDHADLLEEREVVFLPGTTVRVQGLELYDTRAIIYVEEELAPRDPTQ